MREVAAWRGCVTSSFTGSDVAARRCGELTNRNVALGFDEPCQSARRFPVVSITHQCHAAHTRARSVEPRWGAGGAGGCRLRWCPRSCGGRLHGLSRERCSLFSRQQLRWHDSAAAGSKNQPVNPPPCPTSGVRTRSKSQGRCPPRAPAFPLRPLCFQLIAPGASVLKPGSMHVCVCRVPLPSPPSPPHVMVE